MPLKKITTDVKVSLGDELFGQVNAYAETVGLRSLAEACRVLIRQGLAGVSENTAALGIAREALGEVRHWGFAKFREKLGEIEREFAELYEQS